MAKYNISFNNKDYQIDEASLSAASAALKSHLSTVMNGSGATINFGGTAYNIDAAKLATATNVFVSHLGTIAGSGYKVKVGGVEYGVDSGKMAGAVAEIEAVLAGLISGGGDDYNHDDPALHPTEIQEGAVYLNVNTGVYSTMPISVTAGDMYLYQDYMYVYGVNHIDGWQVALATDYKNGYWNYVANEMFGADLATVLLSLGVDFDLVSIDQTSYRAILESINGVPVTDVSYAFIYCTSLTQAPVIPNSVTNMKQTFDNCTSLTQAPIIPNSVTDMGGTFGNCTSLTQAPVIPNSVTNMKQTFDNCTSLTQAPIIPNSVTNMAWTFFNCTSLVQAPIIPNSVTDMGGTFGNCTSLTQAPVIPNSVTDMQHIFTSCESLSGTIEINTDPAVYNNCFHNVNFNTQNITLTGSSTMLDEIGAKGLYYCAECNGTCKGHSTDEILEGDGQEFHKFAPAALTFRSTAPLNELQEVQINGVTVDPSNYTLEEGSTIVTFPIEYLKTLNVGSYEVAVASDSKTVKGGFNVKAPELNEHGFYYNQPYTAWVDYLGGNHAIILREDGTMDILTVAIGNTETGNYTVSGNNLTLTCSLGTLTGVVSSDGTEIYNNEFAANFVLGDESIAADEDYFYIYKEDLGGYEVQCIDKTKAGYGAIKTGINGINTVALGEGAFEGLCHMDKENPSKLYNIPQIPNSVVKIGLFCFRYCQNLTDVVIPNSIITIGNHAFASCVNLHSVIIADSVTTIGARAFGGCGNLTSVTIGNSVTSVGDYAFSGCSSLASVVIPSSVTSIDGWVFYDCSSLASITFNGTTSQWNAITKGTYWNHNVPATYVQCSDGQVSLV